MSFRILGLVAGTIICLTSEAGIVAEEGTVAHTVVEADLEADPEADLEADPEADLEADPEADLEAGIVAETEADSGGLSVIVFIVSKGCIISFCRLIKQVDFFSNLPITITCTNFKEISKLREENLTPSI